MKFKLSEREVLVAAATGVTATMAVKHGLLARIPAIGPVSPPIMAIVIGVALSAFVDMSGAAGVDSCFWQPVINRPAQMKPNTAANDNIFFIRRLISVKPARPASGILAFFRLNNLRRQCPRATDQIRVLHQIPETEFRRAALAGAE